MNTRTTQQQALPDEALQQQIERLAQLKEGTAQLRSLKEQECQLEVDVIAAEAAVRAATRNGAQPVNPAQAAQVLTALDHMRRLQAAFTKQQHAQHPDSAGERARLTAAGDALEAWLEAPRAGRPPHLSAAIRLMLTTGCIGCFLAAVTVHPLFLLLLVPLLSPVAFVRWSRQNASWLRLGAERRYAATGLKPPDAWQADAVEQRALELQRSMEALAPQTPQCPGDEEQAPDSGEQLGAELSQTQALFEAAMAEASLSDIDGETEANLRLSAQIHNARSALRSVQSRRASLRAGAEKNREALFRFLSKRGQASADGRADLQTLEHGLQRVARRSGPRET